MPDKIYLMSVAATGKSTFAQANPSYAGYRVVDFATLMPQPGFMVRCVVYLARLVPRLGRLVRRSAYVQAKVPANYYDSIFRYLRSAAGPIVVLGRPGPEDIDAYADVSFGVVAIPWHEHERNCRGRREGLRNPLPLFDHWSTDAGRVEQMRRRMLDYAERHSLPVFDSFEAAIDGLSSRAPAGISPAATTHTAIGV